MARTSDSTIGPMRRLWIYLIAVVILVEVIAATHPQQPDQNQAISSLPNIDRRNDDDDASKSVLSSMVESMKRAGAIAGAPALAKLRKAINGGDPSDIRRAFQEAPSDRFTKRGELIPALNEYLDSDVPLVRMLAAESLYRIGESNGANSLIDIVKSDDPVTLGDDDLRLESAKILAKYRERRGESAVLNLYRSTKGSGLLSALATMGNGDAVADLERNGFVRSEHSIERYGILKVTKYIPEILRTFWESSNEKEKVTAAWALERMTGDPQYVDYLIQKAEPAIAANPRDGYLAFDESTLALKYLGSVKNEKVKSILEGALDSNNPVAVRYAVVNLLFNQGGSQKAEDLLVRELKGTQTILSSELLLSIAAKSDNAKVLAAGKSFAQRTSENDWKLYREGRREWPIYNWIDDYVAVVDASAEGGSR